MDAWVCLRQNNQTIPDELLDQFKDVLNQYFCSETPNVIVPKKSAEFCASKTLAHMNEQIAAWGDNALLRDEYLKHVKNLES